MKSKSLIIMCLVLCGTLAAAFNPNENLIAHWRLDETTGSTGYDSVSNVDLRLINTTDNSHWVDGKFGTGVNFGGSIAATPDTATWTINVLGGFQEKAISMWVKFHDISGIQYLFFLNWSDYKACVLNFDGQLRMQYGEKGGVPDGDVRVGNTFEADKWYHIVLLSRNTPDDLSQMETWINGELIAFKSGLRRDDSGLMNSVGFGASRPQDANPVQLFNGIMDDVRVYDKGLTQEEISALYEYQPQEPLGSLMVYLPMDEHVSGWVHDEMGLLGGEVWVGPARYQNDFTGSTWNKNGKFGGCFTGDGQMSRIPLAFNPDTFSTEALGVFQNKTVSAWIKPNAVTAPNGNTVQFIFGLHSGAGQPYVFYVLLNNGAIRIHGTEGNHQWTLPVIDGQTWYHIAVVNTNTPDGLSELKLYVNGDYKISKTGIVRDQLGKHYYPGVGASAASAGPGDTTQWRSFYGSIDDFRIYDAALTDTQVADLAGFTPEPKKFDHKRNLELYWQFDQNGGDNLITDSSGNDLYGVMNNYDGNSAQWVNGVFGKAFNFDGSTNSIIFANRQNEFAFGPFKSKTISAWIKPNATSGIQNIAHITPQNDLLKFYFYIQGAYLRVQGFKYDMSTDVKLEVPSITAGQWTHVAVVIREYNDINTSCEVYINGLQKGFNRFYKNSDWTRAHGFTVGASRGYDEHTTNWFGGAIDDFRIYNTDLRPNDVNDIYQLGPVVFADINNDSIVEEEDLSLMAGAWLDTSVIVPATVAGFEKGCFEEYANQAALDAYWSDFGQSAASGSTAMSAATLLTDPADARSGSQALRWQYNTYDFSGNGLFYTDLVFTLDNPIDLTQYDYMSLWLKRAAGNALQSGLYVKFLNGGTGFADAAATSKIITAQQGSTAQPADVWDNWLIDLNNLYYTQYEPIPLTDVRGILFGCWDSDGNQGIGTIDIDDIELIGAPQCSGYIDADITGDCIVNLEDFSMMAQAWLK